jgi:hypothetical protein
MPPVRNNPQDVVKTSDSPLGTQCQDCVTDATLSQRPTPEEFRFRLQEAAARLLPNERVAQCMQRIAPGAMGASVMYSAEEGRAYFRHLITCNRVWECPVCAAKITNKRREEIAAAMAAARAKGWHPVMLTFTASHDRFTPRAGLLGALLEAYRAFTSGKGFQEMKEEYPWMGAIKALEVTHGIKNGWHPHLHVIVLLKVKMTSQLTQGFERVVAERWQTVTKAKGLHASAEYGVKATMAGAEISDYVAKMGCEGNYWDVADEVTKAHLKKSRRGDGRTPFMLLAEYRDGDSYAGRLFQEYAEVFKGRKQIVWSRGLAAALGLKDQTPDEEIEDTASDAIEMTCILENGWKKIVKEGKRGELLRVASTGDVQALYAWLRQFGILHVRLGKLTDDWWIGDKKI